MGYQTSYFFDTHSTKLITQKFLLFSKKLNIVQSSKTLRTYNMLSTQTDQFFEIVTDDVFNYFDFKKMINDSTDQLFLEDLSSTFIVYNIFKDQVNLETFDEIDKLDINLELPHSEIQLTIQKLFTLPFFWDILISHTGSKDISLNFFNEYLHTREIYYRNHEKFRLRVAKFWSCWDIIEPNLKFLYRYFFFKLNEVTGYKIKRFINFITKSLNEKLNLLSGYFDVFLKSETNKDSGEETNFYIQKNAYLHFTKRLSKNQTDLVNINYINQLAIKNIFSTPLIKVDPLYFNTALLFNNILKNNVSLLVSYKVFDANFFKIFNFFYLQSFNFPEIKDFSFYEFVLKLSFLIWTKNAWNFINYLDNLFFNFKKDEQLKILTILSSFEEADMLNLLSLVGMSGLYFKFSGKLGGFAGSRAKYFIIKYGKYSRSSRVNKIVFFQKQLVNFNGAVGLNVVVTYK